MSTTINKKINHIFILLERLARGEELFAQDEELLEDLSVNERTLRRYLEDIHELYGHIVTTEKKNKESTERKVTVYRVVDKKKDVADIFRFFLENTTDLSWLLQIVHENNPKLLDEAHDKKTLEAHIKQDEDVFLFKSNPFESMDDADQQKLFALAKTAVKNQEYRTINYFYSEQEYLTDVKCLKLIFMSNNWYLAVEDNDNIRFLRVSFIRSIQYSKKSSKYPVKTLEKYQSFFEKLQNPMTLNISSETAVLKASSKVALYFMESMKPFFPSQKFVKNHEDGSVEFTVEYTQPLEILPFIKQWQPDLCIISPRKLVDELKSDLHKSLDNYT
ncbi:helix-turn-helix transcriptional regulator [Campylobacterota bacterium]